MSIEHLRKMFEAGRRPEVISPLLPGANWIELRGRFTPDELRTIASEIEQVRQEEKKNGNPH